MTLSAGSRAVTSYLVRSGIRIVGITGTSGKTTTKEMLTSILRRVYRVLKTPGNANKREHTEKLLNERLTRSTRAIVLEMGMDGRGQIAAHCRLTPPNIGIITNVNRGHVGPCGGFMGVVRAKNELVNHMRRRGVLILNCDDEGTKLLNLSRFRGRIVWFGEGEKADYRLLSTERQGLRIYFTVRAEGKERLFYIPTFGEHNVYNALAAIAAARALRIPWRLIARGLAAYRRPRGRLTLRRGVRGSQLIDDTYNANPLSVEAGLVTLKEVAGNRKSVAVLSTMAEQGRGWRVVHQDIGKRAAELEIDALVTIGRRAAAIADGARAAGMPAERIKSFTSRASASRYLMDSLDAGTVALFKGSNATRMKDVVKVLRRRGRRGQRGRRRR